MRQNQTEMRSTCIFRQGMVTLACASPRGADSVDTLPHRLSTCLSSPPAAAVLLCVLPAAHCQCLTSLLLDLTTSSSNNWHSRQPGSASASRTPKKLSTHIGVSGLKTTHFPAPRWYNSEAHSTWSFTGPPVGLSSSGPLWPSPPS